jgi:predicted metalloprotease with PDZ domain
MKDDIDSLSHNKNYFAMSLKLFFVELGTHNQDLLELMCHNYIHSWVNKDISRKQRCENSYQVEEKMGYLRM